MIIGIIALLLIDATMQLHSHQSFNALTREEFIDLDRIENPDLYALCLK